MSCQKCGLKQTTCFYKHMKYQIQAWLCLEVYDFEARLAQHMLNFLRYQTTDTEKI